LFAAGLPTPGAQFLSNTVQNEQIKGRNEINDENKRKEYKIKTNKALSNLACRDNYVTFAYLSLITPKTDRHTEKTY
jgi:hypothetical protein